VDHADAEGFGERDVEASASISPPPPGVVI
jgi:hypothetical protein